MKKATRKNHIIIPELIKKKRLTIHEEDKQNISINIDEPKNTIQHQSLQKERTQQKMGEGGETGSQAQQNESLSESSIRSMMMSDAKRRSPEFSKLQQLLYSQKMFINPDKWSEFMSRAIEDKQFHKALNVFLYSYFIQNYN